MVGPAGKACLLEKIRFKRAEPILGVRTRKRREGFSWNLEEGAPGQTKSWEARCSRGKGAKKIGHFVGKPKRLRPGSTTGQGGTRKSSKGIRKKRKKKT